MRSFLGCCWRACRVEQLDQIVYFLLKIVRFCWVLLLLELKSCTNHIVDIIVIGSPELWLTINLPLYPVVDREICRVRFIWSRNCGRRLIRRIGRPSETYSEERPSLSETTFSNCTWKFLQQSFLEPFNNPFLHLAVRLLHVSLCTKKIWVLIFQY